jgi:hypothetical protein
MTDLAALLLLGDVTFYDVDLQPRVELGAADAVILPGRLSIGEPIMFAISPELASEDNSLREYLRAEAAASTYFVLDLVVTARPDNGEAFSELGLGVRLRGGDPAQPEPIAWSLSPMRSSSLIPVRRTVGLTVKAGLVEPKIEQQSEQNREDNFVVAFGMRESNFEWRYRGSRQHPLDGTYQMQAVIKSPAGVDLLAEIVVGATVQISRPFLNTRQYRAALPPRLQAVRGSVPSLPIAKEEGESKAR